MKRGSSRVSALIPALNVVLTGLTVKWATAIHTDPMHPPWKRRNHTLSTTVKSSAILHAKDRLLLMASKPGGLVAAGSRPDRQKNDSLFDNLAASVEGSQGEVDARCPGKFNRKEGCTPYQKPPKLVEVLKWLYYNQPSKLRPCDMRARMREMRDEDGGLLDISLECY